MDEAVVKALREDLVIDITTTGRKSGRPRRKEIWFHNLDGRLYITGTPGRRDWYANLLADPRFILHLKGTAHADLLASATPVTDEAGRREVFQEIHRRLQGRLRDSLEDWMQGSPLVRVEFTEP